MAPFHWTRCRPAIQHSAWRILPKRRGFVCFSAHETPVASNAFSSPSLGHLGVGAASYMEIHHDLSDLRALNSLEDILIAVLRKLSPTDAAKSKKLGSSFREFFGRGTKEDCLQLCPQPRRAVRSGPHHKTSSSNAAPKFILPKAPSNDASLLDSSNSVHNYFAKKGIDATRILSLNRVIQSFISAKALPRQSYENLWSSKETIFPASEKGLSRTCRLQRGRKKIEESKIEFDCANRICAMFCVHEIDHYSQTAKREDLELEAGRRRSTAALEKYAEVYEIPKGDLHEEKRKTRNYFKFVFLGGPGFILEMGPDAGCWEKTMILEDVKLVLEYMSIHHPERYQRAKSLNGLGAYVIVHGLLAYGWKETEVKAGPTPFLKKVRGHLDKNLKVPPTTNHTKRKQVEEHHMSGQSPFSFDNQIAEACYTSTENQHSRSCSPIAASSSLLSGAISNDIRQSTMTVTSTVNILADSTTSNAVGNSENDGVARWMADLTMGGLRPTTSTEFWLGSNINYTKRSDAPDSGSAEVASTDTSRVPNVPDSNSTQGMLAADESMVSSLDRASCLPGTLALDSNQEATMDPRFLMDTSMLSSLDRASCLPGTLALDSNQETTMDPRFLMDTSMLSSLDRASCLPGTLALDSNQEATVDPRFLMDTSMLSSLDGASCLPGTLALDSNQEATVDPRFLMDTSMLSSLDGASCLPNVLDSGVDQEDLSATRMVPQSPGAGTGNVLLAQKDNGNGLCGTYQVQNGISTHLGIIV